MPLLAGLPQIADRVVLANLQWTERVGDILGPYSGGIGPADAGVQHVDIAASPLRSRTGSPRGYP